MNFFNYQKPIKLRLTRDVSKHLKRGNPWVFADAIEKVHAPEGQYAQLLGNKNEVLAHGFYAPKTNLAFRALSLGEEKFTDAEVTDRITAAITNKIHLLTQENRCLRLINGEGDGLPGIVADYYAGVVVLKLDGTSAEAFWNKESLATHFMDTGLIPVNCVYFKRKNREQDKGQILAGACDELSELEFLENGVKFRSNIIDAAKTGFFLDQRENRAFIRQVSQDKSLLNLFGYTGGFSVYAGLGGASKVTTVDIAPEAVKASQLNWEINLLPDRHEAVCADVFEFLGEAQLKKQRWDIVITDPPSFAPNQKAVASARDAYTKVFSDSLRLVRDGGFFAASSCSGHIGFEEFLEIVQESLSKARRRGKVLLIKGQPEDHPFPLALQEMRYLKFIYLQIFV